ncbi:hypothetical protein [Streptomyces sp. NPDC127084]|uniref:hypothetical protein n=1 Tax=Streptomyces sp. NPDC127084 TaxID=3347133 RepID=UPI00366666AD
MPSGRIVGLLEFSLVLTPADIARYQDAGMRLTETTDCRFGPTLADVPAGIVGRWAPSGSVVEHLGTEHCRLTLDARHATDLPTD